ncbi:MAG: FecR domain-containing protein [Cephaloticoccus sp.]|nr:FecR domain-containing protein [Cephaloticoccus sp.]
MATIEAQATAWLVRRDGGMDDAEIAEFEQWRAEDIRHEVAFSKVASVWSAFDRPVATGQVDALRAELHALEKRDRRRRVAFGSTVALAAAACLAVFIGLGQPTVPSVTVKATDSLVARVVEPDRQILSDGSIVELKHGTRIKVAFTEANRVVILEEGEAHFTVMKNPERPFIVETGDVKVCAVGTAFAVGLGHEEVDVLVTEGRVRVDSSASPASETPDILRATPIGLLDNRSAPLVEAGQHAVVSLGTSATPTAIVPISAIDLNERLSWRLPRLEFSETSLTDAVTMFNRYNVNELHIDDETVAAIRITGVYRSDNVDGFVRALELGFGLRAEKRGSETVLLRGK